MPTEEREEAEDLEKIEVVHRHQTKLQGILKQRSRTMSESSDDIFGTGGLERQTSSASVNGSESAISESDENGDWASNSGNSGSGSGRKKTVSFSEHDDKITYKTGLSVTSMTTTLKSKRRRARKKEAHISNVEERKARRRRTSSGSEHSSDDLDGVLSSPDIITSPDVKCLLSQSAGDAVTASLNKQARKAAKKRANRMVESAAKAKHSERTSTGSDNSTDDVQVDDEKNTAHSEEELAETPEAATSPQECNFQSLEVVDRGSETQLQVSENTAEIEEVKTKNVSPDSEVPSKSVACDKTSVVAEADDSDDDDDDVLVEPQLNGHAESKSEVKDKEVRHKDEFTPDTMLSWKDAPPSSDEHQTKCAFEFTNQVMFDLDVD